MSDLKKAPSNAALAGDMLAASRNVEAARAARQALIDRAAQGAPLVPEELRAASEAIRAAEEEAELAAAVAKAATLGRERCQISAREKQARDLKARTEALVSDHIEAARALDQALAAARAAVDRVNALAGCTIELDTEAHQHNELLDAEARDNATLRAMHRSTWPKARTAGPQRITPSTPLRVELVQSVTKFRPGGNGPGDEVLRRTAEDIVRTGHGRHIAPIPPAE